ncbi:unnamed protein product [Rotaria sordida]|uniref:Dolichyldiphosphatase n=1 Tax=Rotaria sordida TaxID=392033 RepID=A0A814P322_9BILA|nr:unnamed protein product [Rotaria sordida]CAF1306622.1 unnamed protein product [Rotaria sordida]
MLEIKLVLFWHDFQCYHLFILFFLCALIVFRRDIQTIMYFGGFCISEVCNYSLKRFFKQARPERISQVVSLWTQSSSVYLHYHTIAQVVAGAFVGIALGCVWYYFVNYYFTKYVPFIIEHPFGKYLLIRDYAPIPRLIDFQYENEYAEAK